MIRLLARSNAVGRTATYLIFSCLVWCGADAAHAAAIDAMQFEGCYGSGLHSAALVVDFSPGNGAADSFAFQVRFDTPTIGGFELLNAVRSGASGFAYTTAYQGAFVKSLSYGTYSMIDDADIGASLLYWTSADAGHSWTLRWSALADVTVGDGGTLGWLSEVINWYPDETGENWYPDPPESQWSLPVAPLKATPEPSTVTLVVVAGLAIACYRRCRRQS